MSHLAQQQGGVIHVGQLRQKYRWERISAWVAIGRLTAVGRGWLRVPDAGSDLQARFTRAQTQICEPIIACSFSAAEFFGFTVVDDGKLHVTTASGHSVSVPSDVVLHQAPPRSPVNSWPGLRVTDRADTVVDIATMVDELDVLAVLDSCCGRPGAAVAGRRCSRDGCPAARRDTGPPLAALLGLPQRIADGIAHQDPTARSRSIRSRSHDHDWLPGESDKLLHFCGLIAMINIAVVAVRWWRGEVRWR